MNKLRKLAALLTLVCWAQPAFADSCATSLMPLFTQYQAAKICGTFGAGYIGTQANNTYISARNAANGANISVWKVDATDDTVLNADSGDVIKLSVAGTSEVVIDDDKLNFAIAAAGSPLIGTSSVDATDSDTLVFSSASAYGDTRGGGAKLYGNEVSTVGGGIDLLAGNVSTASINAILEHSSSTFNVKDTTSGTVFTVTDAGAVTAATSITATAGNITATSGDFVASAAGKTLSLQEATAGAKCMGSLTCNGASDVTTSTTCATTSSRIFLTRTSLDADTTGDYYVKSISDGVSFTVACETSDTATLNWIIFHESP